jgi:hypothetical protein
MSNWDAMLVKREDLRDNCDILRLNSIGQKDIERLQRYQAFWLELNNAIAEGRTLHDIQLCKRYSQN